MNLSLLIDLDDTLLKNDIDSFLPPYLDSFSKRVSPYIDPNKFVRTLLAGTQEMVKNRCPDRTLREVFEATFFSLLDVDKDRFQELADSFYSEAFPTLRYLTQPIPEAAQLVEESMRRGYRMAIATNPLFPLTAVLQRLAWGNLPADRYPFEVIASYETFHFTKPDPAYFIEVLGRMGWPSGAILVIGDDIEREIICGGRLGLPAYWIPKPGVVPPDGCEAPTAIGALGNVLPWLDSNPLDNLIPKFDTPLAQLAILRATPAILDSFSRSLSPEKMTKQPEKNEWSITEVFCHLRDVDLEVNLPRLIKVLNENNPFLPGRETDPWAIERNYCLQDGKEALRQFISARLDILNLLESLMQEDWHLPARHAIFGPTQLGEIVNIICGHDRVHVKQVYNLMENI